MKNRWCGMLQIPVSPIEESKGGRCAAASRQGEKKDENQVPGRRAVRVAVDGGSSSGISTRSYASGEGQGATVSGNDEEECTGGDEGPLGSAVELQAGTGPLVGCPGDGAHCRCGGFYPRNGEGKGHDGAGRRAGARRQENRRRSAGDDSRPHEQGAGAGTPGADNPFRIPGRLSQTFCGEPRDDGRL